MQRALLAAVALLLLASPASAQYWGGYYGERGYHRGWDDDRPRRRWRERGYGYYGNPHRQSYRTGMNCIIPGGGGCNTSPRPIGSPCVCVGRGGYGWRGTTM